ncbi:MAG: ATP-binding cassette domain-containing protein, partial [Acidimicrobiia bacterium]
MTSPLISIEGLSVQFGGMPVLSNLALSVLAGSSAGVVGPNGSGKTTLMRVLATLTRPSAGGGVVLGAQLGSPEVYEVRHRIGLISHRPTLYGE